MLEPVPVADNLPFIRFYAGLIEGVAVRDSSDAFWSTAEAELTEYQQNYEGVKLGDIAGLKRLRDLIRRGGIDPTRYRSCSEALLRRVLKGQGLYRISNAVDSVNLMCIRHLTPFCVHDADQVQGEVHLRLGEADETYLGIFDEEKSLGGRLLACDDVGPFGNMHYDSKRCSVTENTTRLLLVAYVPADEDPPADALEEYRQLLEM